MKRLLAIDYGKKRIGLAISDPLQITAQPFETWENLSRKALIEKLLKLIQDLDIFIAVLGHPLTLSGQRAELAQEVEKLHQWLSENLPIPVVLWDERLTSVQAERAMHAMNEKPSRNKQKVDRLAAALLLQNFMDAHQHIPNLKETD
ncbi:Holliday junction resolvase RuvX [bacterium]|nr:Holliday junction resolvase RuvX [bacterium]